MTNRLVRATAALGLSLLCLLGALPASAEHSPDPHDWPPPNPAYYTATISAPAKLADKGQTAIVSVVVTCAVPLTVHAWAKVEQPSGRRIATGVTPSDGNATHVCAAGETFTLTVPAPSQATAFPFKAGPAMAFVTLVGGDGMWGEYADIAGTVRLSK